MHGPSRARHDDLAANDPILCACHEYTVSSFNRFLTENPALSFEQVLDATGAGSTCTACLLNLEYRYGGGGGAAISRIAGKSTPTGLGLKQRIYRLLDRCSPMVHHSKHKAYIMPVLGGQDIETTMIVSNRSIMFEGGECAPEATVEVDLFDSEGIRCFSKRLRLEQESEIRVALSGDLPDRDVDSLGFGLRAGTVRVFRRFHKVGNRGTTRPQFEIQSRDGACSVHGAAAGQGRSIFRENRITLRGNPTAEHLFLTINNPTDDPIRLHLAYPFVGGVEPAEHTVTVPGRGIRVHRLAFDETTRAAIDGQLFSVRWSGPASRRVHLLCAAQDLGRFSIDHV